MRFTLCLAISLTSFLGFAQKANVKISVDILGPKKGVVRYYHPIDGVYQVAPNLISDKRLEELHKQFPGFELIEPKRHLEDTSEFKINSLRYYVNLEDLVYVNWKSAPDTANNSAKLDSFRIHAQKVRKDEYQEVINSCFEPFLIRRYEVTNYEYREFTSWVLDSMMRDAIYASDSIDDKTAMRFLKVDDGKYFDEVDLDWKEINPKERLLNRELCNLDWSFNWREEISPETYVPIIAHFYFLPNQRFYKRRELDSRKLVYRYYSVDIEALNSRPKKEVPLKRQNQALRGHEDRSKFIIEHDINIYPDTLKWFQFEEEISMGYFANLYFWHPAFDHYPVVGISWNQAQAYLNWKSDIDNLKYGRYELPASYEIEMVAQLSDNRINLGYDDDEIIPNLKLKRDDSFEPPMLPWFKQGVEITQRVDIPELIQTKRGRKLIVKYSRWHKYHSHTMQRGRNNLTNHVTYLSNNASEWLDNKGTVSNADLFEAYVNYNCFSSIDYCESQRKLDENLIRQTDPEGKLIQGSNWYDERNDNLLDVNKKGIYPKSIQHPDSSFATVGFRYVLRLKKPVNL